MFSYLTVIYIYAGTDESNTPHNTIYAYDLLTAAWQPQPKTYQGVSLVERVTRTWDGSSYVKSSIEPEKVISAINVFYASYTQPSSRTLNVPAARSMAASTQSSDAFFLFGGLSASGGALNDFWKLDLASFKFDQIFHQVLPAQLHITRPTTVYAAQIQLYSSDNIIFVYGGLNATHLKDELWEYRIDQNHWYQLSNSHFYTNLNPTGMIGH